MIPFMIFHNDNSAELAAERSRRIAAENKLAKINDILHGNNHDAGLHKTYTAIPLEYLPKFVKKCENNDLTLYKVSSVHVEVCGRRELESILFELKCGTDKYNFFIGLRHENEFDKIEEQFDYYLEKVIKAVYSNDEKYW